MKYTEIKDILNKEQPSMLIDGIVQTPKFCLNDMRGNGPHIQVYLTFMAILKSLEGHCVSRVEFVLPDDTITNPYGSVGFFEITAEPLTK